MTLPPVASLRPAWWWWPVALLVGAAAFALSCAFVPPLGGVRSMGLDFARMAADPFACSGPFPHRILGPLVAWSLGFGSEGYWLFAHGTVVAFLSLVCATALGRGCPVLGAALLTATVACTGSVEVYKEHVGYAEPAAFTLLLAGAALTRRCAWFWLVMFLGLLNHEGIAFFWPWLLWRKVRDAGRLRRGDAIGAVAAIGAYVVIRQALLAGATQSTLSASVYFAGLPGATALGMWAIAALSIVVYFGVLPVLLAWHAQASGWRAAGVPVLLVLLAIFAMSTFATDVPRFLGFLALPVVFAGIDLLRRPGGVRWLCGLGGATALAVVLQRPVVLAIVEGMKRRMPEPVPAVVVDLWPLFAAYGAGLAAMVVAGRWLARSRVAAAVDAPR